MNDKEGKEEQWKRWKEAMTIKRERKKGMNNKEGKKETWERGKVKPEQRK